MSIITSVLALLGISSCADFKTVEPEDFEASIADMGAQIVDVRTPEEFAGGHIARAVNIDVSGANFLEKAEAKLDKSKLVALYCRSGKRSAKAARILSRKGFDVINLDGGIIAWKDAGKHIMADSPYEVDSFPTKSGKHVWINALMHASIWIQYDGLNIYVDPVRTLGERKVRYVRLPKADLALVTHEHADHFDKELLDSLNTKVVTNRRCAEMLGAGEIMANGDKMDLREDIRIEAVPAYNTTEGHEKFHPKGRDNGYILTLDGLRIYIAGDTEDNSIPTLQSAIYNDPGTAGKSRENNSTEGRLPIPLQLHRRERNQRYAHWHQRQDQTIPVAFHGRRDQGYLPQHCRKIGGLVQG